MSTFLLVTMVASVGMEAVTGCPPTAAMACSMPLASGNDGLKTRRPQTKVAFFAVPAIITR
jgi:hypothetical protein